MNATTQHRFYDSRTFLELVLVVGRDAASTGVQHVGCLQLAHVSPELDAAFCERCYWRCRISGAWFVDVVGASRAVLARPPSEQETQ